MRRLAIPMMALLAASPALAADTALESARACARMADSLQRLVCYDRLFGAENVPAETVLPVPATPAPAADGPEEFGAEGIKRSSSQRESAAPPRTMTAAVKEARESRPNVLRVTLDNGQIWQQMDMDSLFMVRPGDTVTIERGRLGGYRMARTSKGGGSWVRVTRVK